MSDKEYDTAALTDYSYLPKSSTKEDVALIENYKEVAPIRPILYTAKILKEVQNKNIS